MRTSKFIKVDPNILIEYIYDDQNLIGEDYKVLVNIQDAEQAFMSGDSSVSNNIQSNSLFEIDAVTRQYGKVDTEDYNFLQVKDFAGGQPIRYDTIKIHVPINYTFDENIGAYLKVSAFDFDNLKTYDLMNFFFDITNPDTFNILQFSTPPLLFQEKLWGKKIEINVPSVYALSLQRENGNAQGNSVNANLTNNNGFSNTSPVFIDFSFLQITQTINNIQTYQLTNPIQVSIPLTPDFENLGVKIEPSEQGDFFEIFGIFNNSIAEFKTFIDNSFLAGHRYFVQYTITMFEENIKGKTMTFTVLDRFNEKIEFRPIIKFSTTTAIVDVEMKLIDQIDDSQIVRRGAYGMLPDEVSKYSLNLTKINLEGANKPKIFNLKNVLQASDADGSGSNGSGGNNGLFGNSNAGVQIQQVKVPFPVLIDKFNVIAKSETVKSNNTTYFGIGKLQILIYPFDNTVQFTIAKDVTPGVQKKSNGNLQKSTKAIPFDLNQNSEIKLVFKSRDTIVESKLLQNNDNVNLVNGQVLFKVFQSQISKIRKVFDSGINVFYITSKTESGTDVIYTGTFEMYDSLENVNSLNAFADQFTDSSTDALPSQLLDKPDSEETAIVTREKSASSGGGGAAGGANDQTSKATTEAVKASNKKIAALDSQIRNTHSFTVKQWIGNLTTLETTNKKSSSQLKSLPKANKDLILAQISQGNLMIEYQKRLSITPKEKKAAADNKRKWDPIVNSVLNKLGLSSKFKNAIIR